MTKFMTTLMNTITIMTTLMSTLMTIIMIMTTLMTLIKTMLFENELTFFSNMHLFFYFRIIFTEFKFLWVIHYC